MARFPRLLVAFTLLLATTTAFAFTCTPNCEPDPGDSTYLATVQNRIKAFNTRGGGSIFGPAAGSKGRQGGGTAAALPGSESYNYALPILSLRGRNGLDVNLTLFYNSAVWTTRKSGSSVTGATFNGDRDFPSYGFRLGYGYMEYDSTDDFYTLTESDGSKHRLNLVTTNTYESDDNTYIRFYPDQGILRYKSGTTIFYELIPDASNDNLRRPYRIQDTNGNYISITYQKNYMVSGQPVSKITPADVNPPNTRPTINDTTWRGQEIATITDTVNRTITFTYSSYLLSSISDGSRTWTFTFTSYTLKYYFTFTVTNSPANLTSINLLTAVTFPNSTSTKFLYGTASGVADWGIVYRIEQRSSNNTLRSCVSYNYPAAASGSPLSDHPTFTTQTVSPDGSATNNWTHAVTKTNGVVTSYSVTDPTSLKTKTNLDSNGLVTSVVLSNGATTYRTVTNTWTGTPGSNPRITTIVTTLNDTNQQSKVELTYDSYGNVNDVKEYDYGLVLTREIATTYRTDTAFIADRILDRPATVIVYDGAGTAKARTVLDYDTGSLTDRTGTIAGHSSTYTTSKTDRGNVTTVTRYSDPVTPGGSVVRNSSYDILGNLVSADLDCCNQRTWTFSSGDYFSFPASTTSGSGPTLTYSFTYYGTGLLNTVTDPNSKTTTIQYDTSDRVTSVSRSDGTNTINVTTSYGDQAASPTVTQTTPIDTTPKNSVTISTFNGLGWLTKQQLKDNGGTVISTVDRTYDAAGRLLTVTNPYVSTPTGYSTSYTYDGAGRALKGIPPDGSGSSDNWTYAYSGNQVTVTDPAGKQRRSYSDALGRLVRVDEPGGTPGSGTVTISGTQQVDTQYNCVWDEDAQRYFCDIYYDSGTVTITVNGYPKTVNYAGSPPTSTSIAAALVTAINADPNESATASSSGGVVTLTAKISGVTSNFSLSASSTHDPYFANNSFTATPSGSALTGGVDTGTPSMTTPFATYYTYNVLDDLTQVSQGVQTRTYVYNGLGQLTSATTPESNYNAVTYTYTGAGDVYQRVDARGQYTTYCYDGLNRLIKIRYANNSTCSSPDLQYNYDQGGSSQNANGRLTSTVEPLGGTTYTYDALGRITQADKLMDSTHFITGYTYNLASELTQITYPSGRAVAQSYDSIGRMSQVSSGGTNYYTASSYNAASELNGGTYGNNVTAAYTYNNRLQLDTLTYALSGTNLFKLTYGYGYGTNDNGQIQSITDNVDATHSMTYTYDEWSRLKTAQAGSGPTWKLQFVYDRYGNKVQQNVLAGTAPAPQTATSTSTNRLTGGSYSYDAAGNLTADGSHTYAYDAENRISTVDTTGATYTYDAASRRAKKVVGTGPGVPTYYIFSGTKVIAEYSATTPSSPAKEYIYWSGQLVATIAGSTTTYQHPDHLSTRYETNASGGNYRTFGHFPYGEVWYETGTASKLKFTSYARDSESSLDYAIMRSYSSTIGRFTAADLLAGSVASPQSLNRYSYVSGDPIASVDPMGLLTHPIYFPPPRASCLVQINVPGGEFVPGMADGGMCDGLGPPKEGPGCGDGVTVNWNDANCHIKDPEERRKAAWKRALALCAEEKFGVEMTSFTPSLQGQNGSFSGIGPDALSNGGNNATITVTNNVARFSTGDLTWMYGGNNEVTGLTLSGLHALPGGGLDDFTPYENYTGSNVSGTGPLDENQVHELAHSLSEITGVPAPPGEEAGVWFLEKCVKTKFNELYRKYKP